MLAAMTTTQRLRSGLRGLAVPAALARAWAPLAVLAAALGAQLHIGTALVLAASALLAGRFLESRDVPIRLTPFAAPVAGATVSAGFVGATAGALALAGVTIDAATIISTLVAAATGGALARLPGITDPPRRIRTAVVGSPELAVALGRALAEADVPSHEVIGFVGADAGSLGMLDDIERIVAEHDVELLVYGRLPSASDEVGATAYATPELVERVTDVCLARKVGLIEASQLFEAVRGQVPLGTIDGRWFGYLIHPRYGSGSAAAKRAVDVIVGGAMALAALPVVVLAAIAIKVADGGPVLYRQRRVGATGAEFWLPKLRTMVPDAESAGEAVWCRTGDERVTPVGRVLRRLHIDELPQLWSVLRGEMTLVGPRPERPQHTSKLEEALPHYDRRHHLKPGLTGWAQVRCGYAGSDSGSALKLSHDLYYLKHRSLALDLLILVETARILPRPHSYRPPQREESFIAAPSQSRTPKAQTA
jgi:lipopolysaccharide/colanic/teichoic acid biosynthesis glycosyltransferase